LKELCRGHREKSLLSASSLPKGNPEGGGSIKRSVREGLVEANEEKLKPTERTPGKTLESQRREALRRRLQQGPNKRDKKKPVRERKPRLQGNQR